MLTFLLYSLGIVSKIHSIMERKRIDKNATVFLAKYNQNEPHFYFFILSLQLNNPKHSFEIAGRRKSLILSRSLCWYIFFFLTLFEDKLAYLHMSLSILQNDWASLWILLFCIFSFRVFYSVRKGAWMRKTYPVATLAAIHRLFSGFRFQKYSK